MSPTAIIVPTSTSQGTDIRFGQRCSITPSRELAQVITGTEIKVTARLLTSRELFLSNPTACVMEVAGSHSYGVEYQILSRSGAEKGLNEPVDWWSQQFPNGTVNRQITYPQACAISTILTIELRAWC